MNTPLLSDFLDFDVYPNMSNTNDLNYIHDNNAKNTLIVVHSTDIDSLEFLTKILKAINFDITQDVILLSIDKGQKVRLTDIKKNVNNSIENVLLFGISSDELGVQFNLPSYYSLKINNTNFLRADALATVSKNQTKKKQLWQSLQKMFL